MIDLHSLIAQNRDGQNRGGQPVGLPCFCTANEHVLKAVLSYAAETGFPTVIEATCNQVNQDGGYTRMTPATFYNWLQGLAREAGVAKDQLIIGGDHLGPNPWRSEAPDLAMDKARTLVRDYVEAGFQKIHLDASMACGGEPNPSFAQIADRAADLCAVAEAYAPDPDKLVYVIGTEVPIPGGETDEPDALDVTSPARLRDTIDTHRDAFAARNLDAAWGRIVSVVAQPGVDFGHTSIYPFDPDKSRALSGSILDAPGLTFEAHSTDYQSTGALADLVAQHFFFLKVGPELTFRFREAILALESLERGLEMSHPSRISNVLAEEMRRNPDHWRAYYSGDAVDVDRLKVFSYSDRIRYYWASPPVAAAVDALIRNLSETPPPETLTSQQFMGLEFGAISTDPTQLLEQHVYKCVKRYFEACGFYR